MNEAALRPIRMKLNIYGSGNYDGTIIPFPYKYIEDALSQNILYYCYEEASTVESLAKLCGVPAYYVEERIDNLLKREALIEVVKGKYQTNFIIWSDKYGIYCEEHGEKALLPIMDELIAAIKNIAKEAGDIDFYKADRSESDLLYLYGAMAFSYASEHYCQLPYPRLQKKYDGNEWCYLGNIETGKHRRICIGIQHNANWGSEEDYSFTSYKGIGGTAYRPMMYGNWIDVCIHILSGKEIKDIESVASAIQEGYIRKRNDGSLWVTVPVFTREQKTAFDALVEKHLASLMPKYSESIDAFVRGYKKLFPKHLSDDADRMCQNLFMEMYDVVVTYAQRTGRFAMPAENYYCEVMIQHKG